MRGNRNGWTLVELIAVVTLLGVFAIFYFPRFRVSMNQTCTTSGIAEMNSVRTALSNLMVDARGQPVVYPPNLDSQALGPCMTCFSVILANPLRDPKWVKVSGTRYVHTCGGLVQTFDYDRAGGGLALQGAGAGF